MEPWWARSNLWLNLLSVELKDDLLDLEVCAAGKVVSMLAGTDGLEKMEACVLFTLSAFLLVRSGEELAKLPCYCLNSSNFVYSSSSGFAILFILDTFCSTRSWTFALLVESCATENTDIPEGRFWLGMNSMEVMVDLDDGIDSEVDGLKDCTDIFVDSLDKSSLPVEVIVTILTLENEKIKMRYNLVT